MLNAAVAASVRLPASQLAKQVAVSLIRSAKTKKKANNIRCRLKGGIFNGEFNLWYIVTNLAVLI